MLKEALDDSVQLINEIVAYVCNTMVSENAVAYVTVSESDANAQKLVRKAVQVLDHSSQPVHPHTCSMFHGWGRQSPSLCCLTVLNAFVLQTEAQAELGVSCLAQCC